MRDALRREGRMLAMVATGDNPAIVEGRGCDDDDGGTVVLNKDRRTMARRIGRDGDCLSCDVAKFVGIYTKGVVANWWAGLGVRT